MSLITVGELHAGKPPVLLDVRWELGGPPGRDLYLEGHIPGAAFVDLDTALAGASGRRRPPSASRSPPCSGEAMRAAGVSADGRWSRTTPATRLPPPGRGGCSGTSVIRTCVCWMGVSVAGWPTGTPSSAMCTRVEAGDFVPRAGGMPLLDAAAAAAVARAGVLIDARAPERFRGEREPIDPVAGHIPEAVNVPATELVEADGRFLDADALQRPVRRAGVARRRLRSGPIAGRAWPRRTGCWRCRSLAFRRRCTSGRGATG